MLVIDPASRPPARPPPQLERIHRAREVDAAPSNLGLHALGAPFASLTRVGVLLPQRSPLQCVKNQCISKGNTRRWVALNIYIGHLGQRSFPMSSDEYIQKLNAVAQICTGLRQSAYVRQFFAEPPIPRRGLPSRPRADTAVSLRLKYVLFISTIATLYSCFRICPSDSLTHCVSVSVCVPRHNSRSPSWNDDIAEEFFST